MTRNEFIAAVAEKRGITQTEAKNAVNMVLDELVEAAKTNDKLTLVGFGTFEKVRRGARKALNPLTKESITIPPKDVVRFRPSKSFDL